MLDQYQYSFYFPEQIVRPGDEFVNSAIATAIQNVDAAINTTRGELFDRGRTHNVQDLLTLFRYPSAESLTIARAEEIFEQTLEIIHRHVAEGHNYDLEGNGKILAAQLFRLHIALFRTVLTSCKSLHVDFKRRLLWSIQGH